MEFDKTEKIILCELDCNSKQSLASLGKKARLRKESVHYRIKQLENENIILGYPAIISLAKRGKQHAEILLSLQNITVPIKKEIIEFIKDMGEVNFLATARGEWDIIIGLIFDDILELSNAKDLISNMYGIYIKNLSVSFTIETIFFGRKYFMGKNIHPTLYVDKRGNDKIDELDENILNVLADNSRISMVDMARKLDSNPRTISYRIKAMEKSKIIQKYTVALNMKKLKLNTYRLQIKLKNSSHRKRLIEYFHNQINVVMCREVLSDWDLEPTIEIDSPDKLYKLIDELESLFGELIIHMKVIVLDNIRLSKYYV